MSEFLREYYLDMLAEAGVGGKKWDKPWTEEDEAKMDDDEKKKMMESWSAMSSKDKKMMMETYGSYGPKMKKHMMEGWGKKYGKKGM